MHAINGVGLGHVVRLSLVADALKNLARNVSVRYISNSKAGPNFFSCPGLFAPDDPTRDRQWRVDRQLNSFLLAVLRFKPNIVVCDTHWPHPLVGQLRSQGIRTVIILRSLRADLMLQEIEHAKRDFDAIIVPHHPLELSHLLRRHTGAGQVFEHARVAVVGPIARTCREPSSTADVIFTLGGGGECLGTDSNAIELMKTFSATCELLRSRGKSCILAAGPFLESTLIKTWPGEVRKDLKLVRSLTERSIVVARPGYNTCWEAVAAGSHLLLVGSHRVVEDTDARAEFMAQQGLAVRVPQDATALTKAVLHASRCKKVPAEWRLQVNAGLKTLCAEILGYGHLRSDASPIPVQTRRVEVSNYRPVTKGTGSIVVRFDDVDLSLRNADLERLVLCALKFKLRVQLHCLESRAGGVSDPMRRLLADGCELWSHVRQEVAHSPQICEDLLLAARALESALRCKVVGGSIPFGCRIDRPNALLAAGYRLSILDSAAPPLIRDGIEICIDRLSFPGPRWRSEMQVFRELKALLGAKIPAGVCVRAGRVPEYLFTQTIAQLSLISTKSCVSPCVPTHTRDTRV
jgi:predicted glycosyltransferase